MIDLHCHVLPGLDDGAATLHDSVALAQAAQAAGIGSMVATPHIREDYPFDPALIGVRAAEVQQALAGAGVDVRIIGGAEVAISRVRDLDGETLASLCLGSGSYMLVESPYTHATNILEETIFDLQVQGFRIVLAHPERSPSFQEDPDRLAQLVERGVLCSVTAASMMGVFGGTVRRFTALLFGRGLVHNVASDAHDTTRRPVDLRGGFEALDREVPGLAAQVEWFTSTVPEAILGGEELPPVPATARGRSRGLRRLLRGDR
jgi:protein-tyrosine phosphatase